MTNKGWYAIKPNQPNQPKRQNKIYYGTQF